MKQCCEYLWGIHYKLRMMGIPCKGPTYISGDNQYVLVNTTIPDSTLKKKSQKITYHFIREGSARYEWRTSYVNTHENEADLLNKLLTSIENRKCFVRNLLNHIFQMRTKPIHEGWVLFWKPRSIQTMQLTLWLEYWGPVLWYISTVLLYIGSQESDQCGIKQIWIRIRSNEAVLWISLRYPLQAPNDGDTMQGSHIYLRWQPICPGKYDHPWFHPEEEVTENHVSFYPWGICTIWVEDIICQYSWKWGRSSQQATYFHWKSKRFCPKSFKPYLSDERSGGVFHMGCGLIPWCFIPHPKATVDVGWPKPLSIGAYYVEVLPFFLFYVFIYWRSSWQGDTFFFTFLPKVDVTHVRWTTKPLLSIFMRKSYHCPRPS